MFLFSCTYHSFLLTTGHCRCYSTSGCWSSLPTAHHPFPPASHLCLFPYWFSKNNSVKSIPLQYTSAVTPQRPQPWAMSDIPMFPLLNYKILPDSSLSLPLCYYFWPWSINCPHSLLWLRLAPFVGVLFQAVPEACSDPSRTPSGYPFPCPLCWAFSWSTLPSWSYCLLLIAHQQNFSCFWQRLRLELSHTLFQIISYP